ncbi:MAG: NAD(P)-binding domain-containing protein, partial [Armatimonadota bacterium]
MKHHALAPEKWVTLGFGEAAAGLVSAGFLRGGGLSVCLATGRKPSPETRRRLSECDLKATPDPAAVREASVVLSLVTPDAAREAAEMVAPFLSPATLFVDMNSIAGQTAVEIARIVEARGARFVDAA